MNKKYNNILSGVFAWFANKYGFDPTIPRLTFIMLLVATANNIAFAFIIMYILTDLFIVDSDT